MKIRFSADFTGLFLLAAALPLLAGQGQASSPLIRRGNLFQFPLPAGRGELQWLTSSTFRLQYCLRGVCPSRDASSGEPVSLKVTETASELRMRGKYLDVRLDWSKAAVSVSTVDGERLIPEMILETSTDRGLRLMASTPAGEQFHGLNAVDAPSLNLRGSVVTSSQPLLLSSLGYGLYLPGAGNARFDLASSSATRWTAQFAAPHFGEMWFYYGPSLKEIFEEHANVVGPIPMPRMRLLDPLDPGAIPPYAARVAWQEPGGCRDFHRWLRGILHASLSGVLTPVLVLAPEDLDKAPPVIRALAPLFPLIAGRAGGALAAERARWKPYLYTYLHEARDRGLPVIRPLLMQFPAASRLSGADEVFMLGDELLVAPRCDAAAPGKLALPMGLWTDLATNQRYPGRRDIDIPTGAGPLHIYARNGSIVPLASSDDPQLLQLHYFPRLGAEFFLSEERRNDFSQFHAAPALDLLRLEIESLEDRRYEWVVHHVSPALAVESGGKPWPGRWRYDERRGNLHIPLEARAGRVLVLNVRLKEPL